MGNKRYKKLLGFVEKKIGDELVIVPVTSTVAQMNKVFSLNEIGSFIYENINESKTVDEITTLVTKEFDVNIDVAQKDIELFLKDAVAAKVIEKLD